MEINRDSQTLDEHFQNLSRINKYIGKWIIRHPEYKAVSTTTITKENKIHLNILVECYNKESTT